MIKWLRTLLLLAGAALLTRFIPFSHIFRTLNTMIHEFAHAVVTLVMSGQVQRIDLNADHSGVTYSIITSQASAILTSLAGYTGASLFAVLLFYLHARQRHQWGLGVMTLVAAVMIILYVHEGYGLLWLAGFIVLNVIVMLLGGRTLGKLYYLLLAFITLEESVAGTIIILTASLVSPSQAGDAANLASWTHVPAWLWSILFLVFSLFCARAAIGQLLHKRKSGMKAQRRRPGFIRGKSG
ncbi:M50 family metallopeptidase [Paenibacillus sp. P96]|uniref:M50 family metallopeptidase n=1 Tax=Paenibacillus zeirhizosphaerae TaxID=2987519 RepID=A0ABT9FWG2_9BACL|nr:M50 family metallopeptidase [Paenibacillus sp. P96]MDP4099053.1 M50 family metallopeptidase [Paenibacillus sp. P96]